LKHATVLSPVSRDTTIRMNNDSTPCPASGHGASLAQWLRPGSLLVYLRMLRLPKDVFVDGRCYGYWRILDPTCASALKQLVADSGWRFFRMEPIVDVSAFGKDEPSALANALRKATRTVENENLNGLEIVRVQGGKRFSLHTARILAVAGHIQKAQHYEPAGRNSAFKPVERQLVVKGRNLQ